MKQLQFRRPSRILWMVTGLWLAAVASGTAWMAYHANTPGLSGVVPSRWPMESKVQRDPARPTFVMFAHPHCPCTRAALSEMARLMAVSQGRVNAQIWWMHPPESGADWEATGLRDIAESLPGVTLHVDWDGAEAGRFHAETSSHTVLYSPEGQLWFQGGITASRGHEGSNEGRSAVENFLAGHFLKATSTPVFGCPLFDKDNTCKEGGPGCP